MPFERAWLDPDAGKVFCLDRALTKKPSCGIHERAGRAARSTRSLRRCACALDAIRRSPMLGRLATAALDRDRRRWSRSPANRSAVRSDADQTDGYDACPTRHRHAAGYDAFYLVAPTAGVGTMGQHYVNGSPWSGDAEIDPLQPEALVYEPRPMTDASSSSRSNTWCSRTPWQAEHDSRMPKLLHQIFRRRATSNRYDIPAFYARHVWLRSSTRTACSRTSTRAVSWSRAASTAGTMPRRPVVDAKATVRYGCDVPKRSSSTRT